MKVSTVLAILYELVAWATSVTLTFFDGYVYNAWNWLIVIPVNVLLGQLWPVHWLVIRLRAETPGGRPVVSCS
jgi:hypothetical protein